MIDSRSLKVWMLADSMLIVSLLGSFIVVAVLLPLLPKAMQVTKLESNLKQAEDDLNAAQAELIGVLQEQVMLNETLDEFRIKVRQTTSQLDNVLQQAAHEQNLRQELLNLRGSMERALFVIDTSGSMGALPDNKHRRANWSNGQVAWTFAQNKIQAWLQYLPVGSFRLILFNSETKGFPGVTQDWVSGENWQERAKEFLSQQNPSGFTNTERALREALDLSPTCIVLFTDGAPTDEKGNLDQNQKSRILDLLRNDTRKTPINVIALGNYFNEELASFLQEIASISGGGFVGL